MWTVPYRRVGRNTYRAKGHRHVCSYMYSLHLQSRELRPLPSMMCARTSWLCLSLATRHTRAADTTTRRNRRSHRHVRATPQFILKVHVSWYQQPPTVDIVQRPARCCRDFLDKISVSHWAQSVLDLHMPLIPPHAQIRSNEILRLTVEYLTGSGSVERWYHQLWYAINVLVQVRLPILQTLACTEARANH